MAKCIFACVDKTLLLVHPRNCPLIPVDYFPVSCGSYVYLLVISQPLSNSVIYIIYILLPCFCITFPRFCSVFNKTALLSANPQIQEFFFHVYIIMMKNRLHSNNSLSSETVSVSVQFQCIFFARKKNTYAYRHSIYYKNVI